ncbi:hypothetical protein C8Q75DRAFT_807169 [Abortiporus biennis]|nr:hypothetical protein C8Q75DRAFT_807169 [Abortiporus biennis]
MPYAVPSTSNSSSSVATTTTSTSPPQSPPMRPGHRRTRSSFTDERGSGAFVSLGSLPRRRPTTRKAVFHINADDDSPPERDDDDMTSPASPLDSYSLMNSLNTLRLSMNNGKDSPSVSPPSHIDMPPQPAVPFPTSSPMPSPTLTMGSFIPSSPPRGTSLPRTSSSSVILSNGKPLKSSLKSSSSSPNIPGDAFRTKHLRAQSAPSTPNVHKNVHFADKGSGLESVRVFNRSGKPASLSKPPGDETETETEAENSTSSRGYPFPSLPSSAGAGASSNQPIIHEIDPAPGKTSPVPHPNPPLTANIHLETITLPRTRPPTLRGTVLVKNLAYEKNVAVRFTLDDWQTTSEVTCRHVVSLPGLPPPFPRPKKVVTVKKNVEGKEGDEVKEGEDKVVEEEKEDPNQPQWDRFSFTIRLEDYEPKLADRTLWLVARFSCPPSWNSAGGEWWDNNDGNNYRVSFRRAAVSPLATPTLVATSLPSFATSPSKRESSRHSGAPHPAPSLIANALAQQRSFNAPISLKYTPMTGTDAETAKGSASADSSCLAPPPTLTRTMSSPYPSSSASGTGTSSTETNAVPASPASSQPTAASSPSVATPITPSGSSSTSAHPQPPHVRSPNSPPSPSAIHTSSYIKRRLSLSNYVAPSAPTKSVVHPSISLNGVGLATPPTTPPGSVRVKRTSPLPIVPREAEDFLSNTEENSEAEVSRRDYLEEAARSHVHEFEEVDDIVNSGQPVGDLSMGFGLQERDMKGRVVEGEGPAYGLPKLRWGVVGLSSESSESAFSSSSSSSSSTDDLAGRGGASVHVKEEEMPFSPTGLTGKTPFPSMSFGGMSIGMGHGGESDTSMSGLMSPPRSRETSEDGSGEGGRSSPTLQSTPPALSSPAPVTLKSAFTPILGLFSHHPTSSSSVHPPLSTPARNNAESPASTSSGSTTSVDTTPTLTATTTPASMLSPISPIVSLASLSSPPPSSSSSAAPTRVDTSDSSYAAFVRQWCFAQSAPPTPGVTQGSGNTASPHVGSNAPTPPVPGGTPTPPSNGRGYGFPGFSFASGGGILSGGHHHHLGDHAGVVGGE